MSFVHLRVRSAYSLLKGASDVASLVKQAALFSIPAMALSDHDNLFGALEFSNKALKAGIQPIMSLRARVFNDDGIGGYSNFIATNEIGFSNICGMVKSLGMAQPGTLERKVLGEVSRIPRNMLNKLSEGVICLWGGGLDGSMQKFSEQNIIEEYNFLKKIYKDNLYAEICRVPDMEDLDAEERQIKFCILSGLPMVGTVDVWYATPEQHRAFNLLKAMSAEPRQEVLLTDEGMADAGEPVYSLCDDDTARELFQDIPEAYRNTLEIAQKCYFTAQSRPPMLPPFSCEGNRTEDEELRQKSIIGLKKRLDKMNVPEINRRPYQERIDFELSVIGRMQFPGYFLIVSDFIQWAKNQDIPVGPGRGSGVGSVVAWSLNITDLDPLEFGLLFERFLNPDRVSMPDFDIDFCEDRRDEVIQYVRKKYGDDHVAHIATFQIIKGKSALRDTHRIVRHDKLGKAGLGDIDYVSKLIPKKEESAEPMGLEEAYEKVQEFRDAVSINYPKINMVYELAKEVEGLMKSRGLHAAGVIISDRPLEKLIPVLTDEKTGITVSGYSLKGVEEAGLVKFDFLGLTTLSVLKEACNNIRKTCGFDIDLNDLPRDDKLVMNSLSKGDSTGVFQFETGGMRKTMVQVKPTQLEDLIAIVSLYRPGPMQFIEEYALRKNGKSFDYPGGAERTEVYLKETYGIMVYQEQVMQVAQACAGYSLGEADVLRRAMGKKQKAEMDRQRDFFIKGCISGTILINFDDGTQLNAHANLSLPSLSDHTKKITAMEAWKNNDIIDYPGYTGKKIIKVTPKNDGFTKIEANKLFDDIDKFALYGFNKSHAAAYALIGYQTAWIRQFFPAEFYAALMTYCKIPEKRGTIKNDIVKHNIILLPPDINKSVTRFSPELQGSTLCVRYGFCGMKGLPDNLDWIEQERKENGDFKSVQDFHTRNRKRLKKDHLQILASMGAFSGLMPIRAQVADVFRQLESMNTKSKDLFHASDVKSTLGEWQDIPEREFNSVGFYMSGHPLDIYMERLVSSPVKTKKRLQLEMKELKKEQIKNRILCVLVHEIIVKESKNGSSFLQVIVSDKDEGFQINCFGTGNQKEFTEFKAILTHAKNTKTAVILDCTLSMSSDGEQAWVNGNAAISYKDYLDILDISNDTYNVLLNTPSNTTTKEYLLKTLDNVTKMLSSVREDNNPSRTIKLILSCENESVELPGRYPFDYAKSILQSSLTGIIKTSYKAEVKK